jgi:hypothetical protein
MSLNGEEMAEAMSRFINNMNDEPKEVFIEKMSHDHRTLQQNFTRLCVNWLEQVAEGRSDLRNEASVNLGKLFVEKISAEERFLPFI